MDKKEIMRKFATWLQNAPIDADFGIVTDIESVDTVIQIFY